MHWLYLSLMNASLKMVWRKAKTCCYNKIPIIVYYCVFDILNFVLSWKLKHNGMSSIKTKHSSSNLGLWCFNLCRSRLSLAEVLMFSLMFSQALFMFSPSIKFSKSAYLFVISICYCFLTSISFSFLRLYLSPSNFYAAGLLIANPSLTFAITR